MASKNPVVKYLANGRLKEAIEATIYASEKTGNRSLIEQSLIVAGRFNKIQQSKRFNTLEDEYIRLEENKIKESVLDLASKFPDSQAFNSPDLGKKSSFISSIINWLSATFSKLFT